MESLLSPMYAPVVGLIVAVIVSIFCVFPSALERRLAAAEERPIMLIPCNFCGEDADPRDPDTYFEVTTWVHGEKKDGAVLRDYTGGVAHKDCIEKRQGRQAADQESLFPGV